MTTIPIIRYPMESLATLGTNAEGLTYNATASNITIVNDSTYGDVAYFSGNGTSRIDLDTIPTYALTGAAPRSVSFWLNFDQINGNQNIFTQGNSIGQGDFVQVKIGYNNNGVLVEYGNQGSNQNNIQTLAADSWYHFVWTYDGVDAPVYWNGSLTVSRSLTLDTDADIVNIGTVFNNGIGFEGKMKDFRIYDVALTSTEIGTMFSDGPSDSTILFASMSSHLAQLSWNSVDGASSYSIEHTEDSGDVVTYDSIVDLETNVLNLKSGTIQSFSLYSDLDPLTPLATISDTTLTTDSTTVSSMATVIGNDFTLFDSDTIDEIEPYIRDAFTTGDEIKSRVVFNGKVEEYDTLFVSDGGSIQISNNSSVLTPFVDSIVGQSINLELDNTTLQSVSFDEISGTVTIDGTTYNPGDRFIIDGKSCKVAELD